MSSINTHTLGNIEVELPDNEGDDYVARCYELDISAQHPDEYIAISLLCLKLAEHYKFKSSSKSILTSEEIRLASDFKTSGARIAAIRSIRNRTGLSLRQAKDLVDAQIPYRG